MSKKNIKGVTQSGFAYDIDGKRLNNYELVECLSEVDENPLVLPKLLKLLLGDKVNDLKDHIRDEEGLVSVEALMAEVEDIFKSQQVKN